MTDFIKKKKVTLNDKRIDKKCFVIKLSPAFLVRRRVGENRADLKLK